MPEDDLCVTRVPIFQGLTHEEQLRVADFARPVLAKRRSSMRPDSRCRACW